MRTTSDAVTADYESYPIATVVQIFCRTTCPSRKPVRDNIFFVDTADQAISLGFRACRRCKPDMSGGDPHEERQEHLIKEVKARLTAGIHAGSNGKACKGKGLKYIAEDLGVSHWHLHRCFKKRVGQTPEAWAKHEAKRLRYNSSRTSSDATDNREGIMESMGNEEDLRDKGGTASFSREPSDGPTNVSKAVLSPPAFEKFKDFTDVLSCRQYCGTVVSTPILKCE